MADRAGSCCCSFEENLSSPWFALNSFKKKVRDCLNYSNRTFVAQGHKLSLPALGGLGCHGHVVKC